MGAAENVNLRSDVEGPSCKDGEDRVIENCTMRHACVNVSLSDDGITDASVTEGADVDPDTMGESVFAHLP